MKFALCFAIIIAAAFPTTWAAAQSLQPPPADALTAKVDVSDVERFATLWKKTNGHPTAAQIDSEYIQGSGMGVKLFIPLRDLSGATMQPIIAKRPQVYQQALDRCLPWVAESTPDLRSIYLGLHGLLPERPLPQIYMVVGRANTGGTASPGAQLLGLESLCLFGDSKEKFRQTLRKIFAHETAHTFQKDPDRLYGKGPEPLLFDILVEGGADYIASLVTGASANAERDAFGRVHEAELWAQFQKDRPIANHNYKEGSTNGEGYTGEGSRAFAHWLYNSGPVDRGGFEADMGYWLGMQIAKAYVERAADPHAAIREVLALEDPAEILRKSGYADKFKK